MSDKYDGEVTCPECDNCAAFKLFFKSHPDKKDTLVFECLSCKYSIDSGIESKWNRLK